MGEFIKLLTERERLEKFLIILLKIIITSVILFQTLNVYVEISEILSGDFAKSHALICVLFYAFGFVIVWFFLWSVCGKFLQFVIYIFSLSSEIREKVFDVFLIVIGVKDIQGRITEKTIRFTKELDLISKGDNGYLKGGESKMVQYFLIGFLGYITLILNENVHIERTYHIIIIIGLLLLILSALMVRIVSDEVETSLLKLRKRYNKFAYFFIVKHAVQSVNHYDYKISEGGGNRKIYLVASNKSLQVLPIIIHPIFEWNKNIGEKNLHDNFNNQFLKGYDNEKLKTNNAYMVLVGNVKPDSFKMMLQKVNNLFYVYAETEEEMDDCIEELFRVIHEKNHKDLLRRIEN